jgi:hypothetical protein
LVLDQPRLAARLCSLQIPRGLVDTNRKMVNGMLNRIVGTGLVSHHLLAENFLLSLGQRTLIRRHINLNM